MESTTRIGFHFDVMCPWAYQTSKWIRDVRAAKGFEIDWRFFSLEEINLDRINPTLPYHNPQQPFVNYWFSSSFGDKLNSFCRMLREESQDRLEEEAGVCIMYTHFGLHFCKNGKLDPEFVRLMRRLAGKDGWFVPVATLLDHLRTQRQDHTIPPGELSRMERRWLKERLLRRAN